MLCFKNGKVFLEAGYDKKYGMPLDTYGDIVECCMGYEEFETVAGWAIEEALSSVMMDVLDGIAGPFKEFEDLVEYTCRNYI